MTGLTLPAACLCLMTGALLGGLFLFFKLLRGLLYGGRLCAAALDIIFCLVWALTAFLCALVVDKGRLRMFQVVMQVLGAWGTVVALDPFINGVTNIVRRFGRWLGKGLSRPASFLRKRWRIKRADMKAKRDERRKAAQSRKKPGRGKPPGGKGTPRYRKVPVKSKRYALKKKKTKNPLEKLT